MHFSFSISCVWRVEEALVLLLFSSWGVAVDKKGGDGELKTEANVTEWSKVLRSGRSVFARVGSSPTVCIFVSSFHHSD